MPHGEMESDNLQAIEILLLKHKETLTEWELGFLQDLKERLHSDETKLTPKQQTKLGEIWEDVMSGKREFN